MGCGTGSANGSEAAEAGLDDANRLILSFGVGALLNPPPAQRTAPSAASPRRSAAAWCAGAALELRWRWPGGGLEVVSWVLEPSAC